MDIFTLNENGTLSVREAIGQAFGAVSLCWDPKPHGVFQSDNAGDILDEVMQFIEDEKAHVWVVRVNSDRTEGRGRMVDASIHPTEAEAFEGNRNVCGVMGHPKHFGGDIYKVTLGTYPLQETLVYGNRSDWTGHYSRGWVDLRDKPDDDDPQWREYLRLRDLFEPSRVR